VVEFLRRFPQFPEVVMAVARKMDVKFWRALFHFVGDPAPLFERCVESRQVHMAASYLRILQNIAGVAASRRAALKLLELALEQEDIELAGDLARFLEPMSTPDVLDDIDAARDDEEFYTQELLLGRYARNLLHHLNLRDLLRFARLVAHEIRPWLARERCAPPQWPTGRQRCSCCTRSLMSCFRIRSATSRSVRFSAPWRRAPSRRQRWHAMSGAESASTSDDLRYLLGELVAARCFRAGAAGGDAAAGAGHRGGDAASANGADEAVHSHAARAASGRLPTAARIDSTTKAVRANGTAFTARSCIHRRRC
jgi:hypothetical protein